MSFSPELARFLDTMHEAIRAGHGHQASARATAERIFGALADAATASRQSAPASPAADKGRVALSALSMGGHLNAALHSARSGPPRAAAHADALADLAPMLTWYRRKGSEHGNPAFHTGHANATIIGDGGQAEVPGVWIGVSLLAPEVVYPDHRHPPEEVYVVLSPGFWRQADGPWHPPGVGGIVYNPPDIVHAMRAGSAPLLATWCLWQSPKVSA